MRTLLYILLVSAVSSALMSSVAAQIFRRNVPRRTPSVQRSTPSPVQETEKQDPPPVAPPQITGRVVNIDKELLASPTYQSLLTERLALQKSVERAVLVYRQTRLEVHERSGDLKKYLENRPYDDATKTAFQNAYTREENLTYRQASEIEPELAVAYSYWKENLRPYELHLTQLAGDINKHVNSGVLERLFAEIRTVENSRERSVLGESRQDNISKLLAESQTAREGLDSSDVEL